MQEGLSRNKVSVGEPADGSPPKKYIRPGTGSPVSVAGGSSTKLILRTYTYADVSPGEPVSGPFRARRSAVDRLLCKQEATGSNPVGSIRPGAPGDVRLTVIRSRIDPGSRVNSLLPEGSRSPVCASLPLAKRVCGSAATDDDHRKMRSGLAPDLTQLVDAYAVWMYGLSQLLRQLGNRSAQEPMKVVPSCDNPRVVARRL